MSISTYEYFPSLDLWKKMSASANVIIKSQLQVKPPPFQNSGRPYQKLMERSWKQSGFFNPTYTTYVDCKNKYDLLDREVNNRLTGCAIAHLVNYFAHPVN